MCSLGEMRTRSIALPTSVHASVSPRFGLLASMSYLPQATDKANKCFMLADLMHVTKAPTVARLRQLSASQMRLLLRATVLLGLASAAVSVLPFRMAIRLGSVRLGRQTGSIEECVWAVEAAARRIPWRAMCIEKGLAVQRMLRSRGVEAILHYGARHHRETGNLEAHVWVMVDSQPIVGGAEAPEFAPIATYP